MEMGDAPEKTSSIHYGLYRLTFEEPRNRVLFEPLVLFWQDYETKLESISGISHAYNLVPQPE
jgi:hypothetical protein